MKTLNKPTWILFIGILAVSTASLFIRNAQQSLPSTIIAAGRLSIASLVLLPFVGRSALREMKGLTRRDVFAVILSGIFLGIHFIVWIKSLELTTIATSVILVTTTPVWVAIASPVLLKEKITRQVVIGLATAMLGICLLFFMPSIDTLQTGFSTSNAIGNALALLGAWMAAAYTIVGRKVRNKLSLGAYIFPVYSLAACVALLFAVPEMVNTAPKISEGFIWIVLLALIPQLAGHTMFNAAVRRIPAVYASIALLGEPIGTIILAWLFLQEAPGVYEMIGGFCVLAGIAIAFWKRTGEDQPLS